MMLSLVHVFRRACVLFVAFLFTPFFFTTPAISAETSNAESAKMVAPDVLIKNVTEEILVIIKEHPIGEKGDLKERKKVVLLIEEKLAPHFDFMSMTKLAMGPHWRKATAKERQLLAEEFRTLLLHTYSEVFLWREENVITVKPFRMAAGDTDVVVHLVSKQSGSEALTIDIALEKTDAGWKAYDVIVGGMSLVTNYRGTFASEIEKSGVGGLIKVLAEKNHPQKKK